MGGDGKTEGQTVHKGGRGSYYRLGHFLGHLFLYILVNFTGFFESEGIEGKRW